MDVFEKVQQTKPEIEGADENLAAARMRLMTEIQGASRPAPARSARRPWFIAAGVVGAAAAVTAGVLVVGNLTAPAPAPTVEAIPTRGPGSSFEHSPSPEPTPATAPEVLQGAAAAAAQFVPPHLAPGQYLRHDWAKESLYLRDSSTGLWSSPQFGVARATATGGWTVRWSGSEYSPADPHDEWYRETGAMSVGKLFGDVTQADATSMFDLERFGSGTPLHSAGGPPSLPEGGGESILWFFESMPSEPTAMIAWIENYLGDDLEGWEDGKVGWQLIQLLSYNVGDPAMRAAMYRALSTLPGSTVGAEIDGVRTVAFDAWLLNPETGTRSLSRWTLAIEMSTGVVTETTSTVDVGEGQIPPEQPDVRTTFTMSVVDALP